MLVVNAGVVFKHIRRKKVGIRAFQKELVDELLNINQLLGSIPKTRRQKAHLLNQLKRLTGSKIMLLVLLKT